MSFKEFNGWEYIDGTGVQQKEIDTSFAIVMQQARAIEGKYISKLLKQRATRLRKAIAATAAIVILIAIPVAIHLYHQREDMNTIAEASVPNGQIKEIILEDGSKVTLNASSTLSYPEKFERKRIVTLSGEAVFEVSSSRTRPFIVKTEDIKITAHGTVFNVRNYPSDPIVCATLCSGKISVSRSDKKTREINLEKDQSLTYEKKTGATVVTTVKAEDVTSWKDGDLRIGAMKLEQVVKVIERRFDVCIHLTTDKYSNATLTAKFINNETLVEVMDTICKLIPGMKYVMEDDHIYIM